MQNLLRRREIFTLGVAALATGCGGGGSSGSAGPFESPVTPPPTQPPATTPSALTVVNGVQTVTKTPGATLDVFANADPTGQVFDKWAGSTAVLLNASERLSGTLAPTSNSSITATYKPLAQFIPQSAVLNGVSASSANAVNAYWYFSAPLPRGVIFRSHGAGGNGLTQFTKTEELKFARDAVADGYAVVSLDSNDRVNKTWDGTVNQNNPTANVDAANIQALIALLTSQGLMSAMTPKFASGHSAGAGNALRIAYLLNWKASHQHCVPGTTQIANTTTVPGIWTMAQNDTREDPKRNADALTNSNALSARGVATTYIVVSPSAVYPSRFTQIVGLSASDSTAIYTGLKTANLLDANDYQLTDPNDVNLTPVLPPTYSAFAKDIQDLLFVAYAAHQFSSATSRRVLAFFGARLA